MMDYAFTWGSDPEPRMAAFGRSETYVFQLVTAVRICSKR